MMNKNADKSNTTDDQDEVLNSYDTMFSTKMLKWLWNRIEQWTHEIRSEGIESAEPVRI